MQRKKTNKSTNFNFPNHKWNVKKYYFFLNEKNYTSYLHDIGIQIYNKLVNMGLGTEISFHEFFLELQIGKNTYWLALQCTLWKPILFLKCKPCDICTNVFNIHVGPFGEWIHMYILF
jgi:hypothetical protein